MDSEGTGSDFCQTGSDMFKPEVKYLWPEMTFISHWMWFCCFILTFVGSKASKTAVWHIFLKCHLWHRKWPKFTSDILKWSLKWLRRHRKWFLRNRKWHVQTGSEIFMTGNDLNGSLKMFLMLYLDICVLKSV